jgi:hypothetical protein
MCTGVGAVRAHAGTADPLKRPQRWVVERLHSWLNRSRVSRI